jgi:hypothetical protein
VVLIDSFKASPQKLPAQGGEHKPLGNGFQEGDKSVTTAAKRGILRSKRQKRATNLSRQQQKEVYFEVKDRKRQEARHAQ